MKRKTVFLGLLLLATCSVSCWAASGAITLECRGTNYSETLVLSETEAATVKTYLDFTMGGVVDQSSYEGAFLELSKGGQVKQVKPKVAFFNMPPGAALAYSQEQIRFTVAGPATLRLRPGMYPDWFWSPRIPLDEQWALLTLEVEPTPFAPDKATTIGPNAGTVGVLMEISTNLIDWVAATNGVVYTNSPAARFFRIKMDKTTAP